MKKYLPQIVIATVVVIGLSVYAGSIGTDLADPPRGGFINTFKLLDK